MLNRDIPIDIARGVARFENEPHFVTDNPPGPSADPNTDGDNVFNFLTDDEGIPFVDANGNMVLSENDRPE